MKKNTLYDIISPIMIGPSSSHTAGAVRIGCLAREIYSCKPQKVTIRLYNSYAHTGRGHGTEQGLLAGLLGLKVDDRRIKDIFTSDMAKTIEYKFEYADNLKYHPNSVDIIFEAPQEMIVSAESTGGGKIKITKINEFNVDIRGEYNTIVLVYKDMPGMLSQVTSLLQFHNINIASLYCDRNAKGEQASMIICIDGDINEDISENIKEIPEVYFVSYIQKTEG